MPEKEPMTGASAAKELTRIADELLPRIISRFTASKLGELEIRQGDWRIGLRKAASSDAAEHVAAKGGKDGRESRSPASGAASAAAHAAAGSDPTRVIVGSPAVGYFLPIEGREAGRAVKSGETLAYVEMLGVRHDVVATSDGRFGMLMAEPGQAVEYGQGLVRIDLAGAPGDADAAAVAPGPRAAD